MTFQNCSLCPQLDRCWVSPPNDELRIINLLVCRIKIGLERDKSTKTLLEMLRPKVLKTMTHIQTMLGDDPVDSDTLISEIESAIIEYLQGTYLLGERAYPLTFLFGPKGWITNWALNYANSVRRYNQTNFYLEGDFDDDVDNQFEQRLRVLNAASTRGICHDLPFSYDDASAEPEEPLADFDEAMAIINDGHTLTIDEYRVLSFCLRNASTVAANPVANLHSYLATSIGLSRRRITRVYGSACRRLIEAIGRTEDYLAARGIEAPKELERRRKQWAKRQATNEPLSQDNALELLRIVAENDISVADACHAYGISDTYFFMLRARYGELLNNGTVTRTDDLKNNGHNGIHSKK